MSQRKLHHRLKKMQHKTIGGTAKYLSCAVTVQQKKILTLNENGFTAGIAARNA